MSGVTGSVTKALLFWHGINTSSAGAVYGSATPSVNTVAVVGTSRGDAGNNCWGPGSSRTYVADVTSLVPGNGAYDLAGMASTPGDDANGASLVVFFNDGNPANNRDVVLFEGNDSNFPQGYPGDDEGWHASLPGIDLPAGGTAGLQLHVADGQDFGQPDDGDIVVSGPAGDLTIPDLPGVGRWDGTTLPDAGHSRATNGALFDIESFDITSTVSPGANTVHIDHTGTNDCLGLVVALIDLPVGAAPPPPASCSINDVTLNEGNAGTTNFTFNVTRTSGVGTASVDFSTADNTAYSSSDYNAVSGTVNFAANDTSEPITVQVNGDTEVEIDEVFTVDLANASGCVLLDPNGFGTVQNDDSGVPVSECGDPGTNRFSIGDASVIEGDSGAPRKLRLAVTVTNPAATEIHVDYTINDGSATAPDDFNAKVGVTKTLKFKPNSSGVMATTKFVTVKVLPDEGFEGDEFLTVTLSNPTGGYSIGRGTGTGTIIDDDGGAPDQTVGVTGASICEGDTSVKGNKVGYQVTLRDPAAADTEVIVMVVDGSATGGVDYKAVPKPKKVKFKMGQVQKTVSIVVYPDFGSEPDENVSAFITTSPIPVFPSASSANGFILNDDVDEV